MGYSCHICQAPSPPGMLALRHNILRPDGTISRELLVCRDCSAKLSNGMTLGNLRLKVHQAKVSLDKMREETEEALERLPKYRLRALQEQYDGYQDRR